MARANAVEAALYQCMCARRLYHLGASLHLLASPITLTPHHTPNTTLQAGISTFLERIRVLEAERTALEDRLQRSNGSISFLQASDG